MHLLLTKFTSGKFKYQMHHALLIFKSDNRYHSSRLYESNKMHHMRYKSYRNIESDKYEWFDENPGVGWVLEGTSKNMKWWIDTITLKSTMMRECPSSTHIKWGTTLGTNTYNNGVREIKRKESPGDGWIRGSLSKMKGNDNWQVSGHYELNGLHFLLASELADHTGLTEGTCVNICKKELDVIITEMHLNRNIYLQNLSYNPIGLSWREIGFNYTGDLDKKTRKGTSGINSKGMYSYQDKCYRSAKELSDATGIGIGTINRHKYANYDVLITKRNISQSSWLKGLPFDPEGMSYRELGLEFHSY